LAEEQLSALLLTRLVLGCLECSSAWMRRPLKPPGSGSSCVHPRCAPIESSCTRCLACRVFNGYISACTYNWGLWRPSAAVPRWPEDVQRGGTCCCTTRHMFNGVAHVAPCGTCSTGGASLAELLVPVAHMFNGWRVQSCSTGGVSGCSTWLSACSTGCLLLSMADVSWS
jgi:hypothetical protein